MGSKNNFKQSQRAIAALNDDVKISGEQCEDGNTTLCDWGKGYLFDLGYEWHGKALGGNKNWKEAQQWK